MRVAALYGIHGDLLALEALPEDVRGLRRSTYDVGAAARRIAAAGLPGAAL